MYNIVLTAEKRGPQIVGAQIAGVYCSICCNSKEMKHVNVTKHINFATFLFNCKHVVVNMSKTSYNTFSLFNGYQFQKYVQACT